ncbi:DUF885 domain-containing protein [Sphingomonas sp. CJ99]
MDRRSLIASAATLLAGASLPRIASAQRPATGDGAARALIDLTTEAILIENPEGATSLGIDRGARAGLKARMADKSLAGVRAVAAAVDERIAAMKAVDPATLGEGTRIDLEVTLAAHEIAAAGYRFPYGDVAFGGWRNSPYVVAQNVGAFLDVPQFLDDSHTVETAWDAEAYLARLDGYARQLDGETERLRDAAGRGVILPDFNLAKAINQLKIAQTGDPADWTLVTSLARRTQRLHPDYAARAERVVRARIAPALARQLAELERHAPRATSDAGVWKLPDGDAYYAWALGAATTTRMTPDEIHEMGMVQLAELQGQMDTILQSIGYRDGTVGERMTALGKDPKYLFPNNDQGRRAIIALLEKSIADMRRRMPDAFTVLAPGNVEVKRMAPEVEPGAPGAYGGAGTIDGKVPGRLWINLRTTEIWPRYALPDLAFHESIPGHAWQGEYTFKLPLIRSILGFNAYSEGWALYAEQLADELGYYADDPVMRLGYLQSLAFRACRLVVDTGLHAKRWTRDYAVQWFATTNGSTVEEVRGEVDRYCSWPGQACGYKVGHSYINRLRDRAKAALGPRYDFRTFNDSLITGGGVPMTVLDKIVDRYVQRRSA